MIKCFDNIIRDVVTMETKIEDLGLNGLDKVDILMYIENKFKISIPDDDAELMYIGTIKNLKTFLRKYGVIDIKEVRKEKLEKIRFYEE